MKVEKIIASLTGMTVILTIASLFASKDTALTRREGGSIKEHWIPKTLEILSPTNLSPPKVNLVPAIRKFDSEEEKAHDFSGSGITYRLAKLQNPKHVCDHLYKTPFAFLQ